MTTTIIMNSNIRASRRRSRRRGRRPKKAKQSMQSKLVIRLGSDRI